MTQEAETLTSLVAERVGDGRGMTYREFAEKAVDPETGDSPSRDTLWKIRHGKSIKVDPSIVRAVAAALRLPRTRVQAAAAYQYTGLVLTEVAGGMVLHNPAVEGDTSESRKAVQAQQEREQEQQD
ncbi:hypothetical protein [Streptomyces antibioticus]|uniref:hypothetical protein n=1 Tax=Streptomyces antibioticus TaxID=1890 RepID=UPI0033C81792